MKVGPEGLALIKHFEGLRLVAYKCPAGVWTIGYGHTGKDVAEGMTINEQRAEHLLAHDLTRFEDGVERCVFVDLQQHQFDALCSFAFNVGIGALEMSTLLKRLNRGDYLGASDHFPEWCKADGKELPGLKRRRFAEQAKFRGGDWRDFA